MIFHHESILTDEKQTILGIVNQKLFGFEQHKAALESRLLGLIEASPTGAYEAIETYLHISPMSRIPEEMATELIQCDEMVAFLVDVRHNWQSVTKEEMTAYYKGLEASQNSVMPSVETAYSQRQLEGLKQTYTLSEFLEVLSQY